MTNDGFATRLAELVGSESKSAFAKRCGFSVGALATYLNGSMPAADKAMRIADICDVRLEWLIVGEGPKEPEGGSPEGVSVVPRYDVSLATGHGSFVERAPLLDHIPFTDAFLRRKLGRSSTDGLVMLDARGDSMEPTIEDGDLVMVDMHDDRLREGLIAFVLDDAAYLKRIRPLFEGGVEIISDNSDVYPPQRLDQEQMNRLQMIGRVRWVGKVI